MKGDADLVNRVTFTNAEVGIFSLNYNKEFRYRLKRDRKRRPSISPELLHAAEFEPLTLEDYQRFVQLHGVSSSPNGWKVTPPLPEGFGGGWSHRFLPTSRLINPKAWSPSATSDEDFYDASFARELERVWNEFFGSVQAQVRQIQQQGIASILGEVIAADIHSEPDCEIDALVAYEKATSFVKRQGKHIKLPSKQQFQTKFHKDPLLRRLVTRIIALESDIEKTMERRTKLQDLVQRMFSGRKRMVLGDTKVSIVTEDDSPLELLMLSSGEKHLLIESRKIG